MRIDAHCHTDCSDGNITIEERIALARSSGFGAATITDHDFISSEQVLRATKACGDMPFISGIELSLRYQGQVVHLLGYFLDPANTAIQEHIAQVQEVDFARTLDLIKYFAIFDYRVSSDELVSSSLHTFYSMMLIKKVANDLFENDTQRSMQAYLAALKWTGLSYTDFTPWDVKPAIEMLHAAGGITVLAHPGGINDPAMRALGFLIHDEEHIHQYVEWGLDGIEIATPVHSPDEKEYYSRLALKYDLFPSAGSDCHGDDPFLGPALMGIFQDIPQDSYESMIQFYLNYFSSR